MSKLSPLHEISSNFFINMSQAEFMSGTICFILCALKVGVRVLRMRFHSSPWATVNILSRGSGNLSSTCQRKIFLMGRKNLLKSGKGVPGNVPELDKMIGSVNVSQYMFMHQSFETPYPPTRASAGHSLFMQVKVSAVPGSRGQRWVVHSPCSYFSTHGTPFVK